MKKGPFVTFTSPSAWLYLSPSPMCQIMQCLVSVALLIPLLVMAETKPLTLAEAERLAIVDDPAVAANRVRAAGLREAAIADGQWSDPKFKLGLFNLPLDSLEIDQNPTTQLRFGVQQQLPRGDSLHFKRRLTEWQATREEMLADNRLRKIRQGVRERFLEIYYQRNAGQIIEDNRALFLQLVEITQAHYASGSASQQDVLRAELELFRLEDRLTRIHSEEEGQRAALAKWLGNAANQAFHKDFPALPKLPSFADLQKTLDQHPLMMAETARIQALQQAVWVAREQYKPAFGVGFEYRKRFGNDPGGNDRADMAAAMLTVALPVFPKQRQDRRLSASQRQAEAAQRTRDDQLRQLQEILDREYAHWRRLGERQKLYQEQLLTQAAANSESSLNAYQNGVTEFTTLMRARITELEVRLVDLRVRVDRAKTQARLLYLTAGENI